VASRRAKRAVIVVPKAEPRNPLVTEAVARKAGPMKDRRTRRSRDHERRDLRREVDDAVRD
jgi:hypothetical protein